MENVYFKLRKCPESRQRAFYLNYRERYSKLILSLFRLLRQGVISLKIEISQAQAMHYS